jgi:hypothetical protein
MVRTAALVVGPALVAALAERAWVRSITGGAYDSLRSRAGDGPWLGGRLAATRHDLVEGAFPTGPGAALELVALVLMAGLAFVALRRWGPGSGRALDLAAAVAVAVLAVRLLTHPATPVPGLLAAWPLAVVGLAALPRLRDDGARALAAVVVLTAIAVLATSYPEGGGVEWGGRFLSPLLAPLAVLVVAALHSRLEAAPPWAHRRAIGALAVVAVAGAVAAVTSVGTLRARHERLIAAVARHPAEVTVTTLPAFPRLSWSVDDRVTWMLTDPDRLPAVLARLRERGVRSVAVLVDDARTRAADVTGWPAVDDTGEPSLRDHGYRLYRLSS